MANCGLGETFGLGLVNLINALLLFQNFCASIWGRFLLVGNHAVLHVYWGLERWLFIRMNSAHGWLHCLSKGDLTNLGLGLSNGESTWVLTSTVSCISELGWSLEFLVWVRMEVYYGRIRLSGVVAAKGYVAWFWLLGTRCDLLVGTLET